MATKRMNEFKAEEYGILLAGDKIDASKGVLFGGSGNGMIPPDTHNRTILIGMGGTGIKTINHIKGSISRKLSPNWTQYVAFMGIDADWTEFKKASHLTDAECVVTTLGGVAQRAQNEAYYPHAWRVFADHDKVTHLSSLDGAGSGRNRLMGKMKIHDQQSGSKGVDHQIVEKLISLKGNTLAPTNGTQNYEVYVIGSVSGGTCSGGFTEMPALIRRALNVPNVHIHAMLYLPDTLTALDPVRKDELEANGYASLKELNYYQGINMRKGYSEGWSYNDPAAPELKINASQDFFTLPYLVGTKAGPANNSTQVAQETIAEFFVSILGDISTNKGDEFLVTSFLSNASLKVGHKLASPGNPEIEAPGSLHEFPKHYGAIGFASASAPEEIVRAYTVSRACETAGLKPVDEATRAAMIAKGETMLPFLGREQFLTASDGTSKSAEILKPLFDFMAGYQKKQFDFQSNLGLTVTWDEIRNGAYDNHTYEVQISKYIESMTNEAAKKQLDQDIQKAFAKFKENVQAYVTEYGPIAFYNLYKGSFIPENNNHGAGIGEMISRISSDRDPKTGTQRSWSSAEDARAAIGRAKEVIVKANPILTGVSGKKPEQINSWVSAKNTYVNLSVNEKRREYVLGNNKALARLFESPAGVMADQLNVFGELLDRLADIYQTHGEKLSDYEKFKDISDFATEVNIAAVNTAAHEWLQNHANNIAAQINGKKIRDNLVNSFFADPNKWLDIPEEMLKTTEAGIMLENPDEAVPARKTFDTVMSQTIGGNTTISIEKLFVEVDQRNVDYDRYARQIIEELAMRSQALFDGNLDDDMFHRYIMYPQALNSSNPAIVTAIQQAAQTRFPGIGFYGSAYADSIMMYQLAAPFEVYRLNALANWEKQYEVKIKSNNGLHGRSPDLKKTVDAAGTARYSELTAWDDYPSIIYAQDPTKKDPDTGLLSREGEIRLQINKLLDEARELGVLYSKEENGKWSFYRVYCDKSRTWSFDVSLMRPDRDTGLYPIGEKMVEAVAVQNDSTVAAISRAVELHNGGLMNQPHSTEDWAWFYAKRVLYVHRPILIEIRETVKLFREWGEWIRKENVKLMQKWRPAKMIRMMQGHVLFPDDEGYWNLEGSSLAVANLSDAGRSVLHMRDPKGAALVDNGFVLYYIYKALNKRNDMAEDGIDSALAQAKAEIEGWNDEDLLMECFARTEKMLKEETQKLIDLGANLDEPEKKPTRKFVEKMEDMDIEEERLYDLCMFYKMAKLWKKV